MERKSNQKKKKKKGEKKKRERRPVKLFEMGGVLVVSERVAITHLGRTG